SGIAGRVLRRAGATNCNRANQGHSGYIASLLLGCIQHLRRRVSRRSNLLQRRRRKRMKQAEKRKGGGRKTEEIGPPGLLNVILHGTFGSIVRYNEMNLVTPRQKDH